MFRWWQLRYYHMHKIRADLATERAPATVNKTLVAVRQVLKHCRRLKLMTAEDCADASDCPRVRGSRVPPGRALDVDEIQRLLAQTEEAPVLGVRNGAIVMVLAGCGLRRNEAASLDIEDYVPTQSHLRVLGKGNKERLVPLHPAIGQALQTWIQMRGPQPGPLFYRGQKGDLLRVGERITARGIYSVVTRLASACDVLDIMPHDFRRTFISVLLDQGKDLAVVSKLVGHAKVETTARYDRRGERAGHKAVEALDIMFKQRGDLWAS
jgi:integrase